jgi:hypothetical protein
LLETHAPKRGLPHVDGPLGGGHPNASAFGRGRLLPIQQAELILDKLKAAGVETKLVVKKGAEHGWPDIGKDMSTIADWFDGHLKAQKGDPATAKP